MTNQPVAAPPAGATAGQRLNIASLVMAALLLVASVLVGVWLIKSAPTKNEVPAADPLTSQSEQQAYGGDAYTGIQNAAAQTEKAVVDGTNTLTDLASELQKSQADAQGEEWGHLWKGLAALIIAIGVANFIAALQRFSLARSRSS